MFVALASEHTQQLILTAHWHMQDACRMRDVRLTSVTLFGCQIGSSNFRFCFIFSSIVSGVHWTRFVEFECMSDSGE